jgi:hypothetical protein
MEEIAARRAAESLLAKHKANVRFKPLGPPNSPATISDANDIRERYVALLRGEYGDGVGYKVGLSRLRCRRFAGLIIPSPVSCPPGTCIDQERPCGARISGDSAWNSKSPSGSNRISRSRTCPVPPK